MSCAELKNWTTAKGISKSGDAADDSKWLFAVCPDAYVLATYFICCTAGTAWLQQMRGKTVADCKVNKTFRNARDKGCIKQQLNPLFLVVQVAALASMVSSVMKAFAG